MPILRTLNCVCVCQCQTRFALQFEIWTESKDNGGLAQLFVSPATKDAVKSLLYSHRFVYHTMIDDVGRNISAQLARLDARRQHDGHMDYDYGDYNDYDAVKFRFKMQPIS